MKEWITGRNPVFEVLSAGRRQPFHLLIKEGARQKGRLAEIIDLCASKKVRMEQAPQEYLDKLSQNNQGVALQTSAYPYSTLHSILESATDKDEAPFILILDTLQDPQNMGTLLRTAEIVGVQGVLIPLRHTVGITPAVVNASSGGCEHLLIAQVNLAQMIRKLKAENIWIIGLDDNPESQPPDRINLTGPIALVVGSEGRGMRPLVRESCDLLLRLPMKGRIESLNAAIAGSIALYLTWRVRGYT